MKPSGEQNEQALFVMVPTTGDEAGNFGCPDPVHSPSGSEQDEIHGDNLNNNDTVLSPEKEDDDEDNMQQNGSSVLNAIADESLMDGNLDGSMLFNSSQDDNDSSVNDWIDTGDNPGNGLKRMYQCQFCDKSFRHVKSLRDHNKKHFGISYKCEMCFKILSDKKNLKRHRASHMDVQYPCPECEESFEEKIYLVRHSMKHIPKQCYLCEECEQVLVVASNLETHCQIHPGKETHFTCNLCYFRCPMIPQLIQHTDFHNNIRTSSKNMPTELMDPHPCPDCDKVFSNANILAVHVHQRHSNEKLICDICNKSYASKSSLRKHKCIDDVVLNPRFDRPSHYECKFCGKSFIRSYSRNRHELTHAVAKKYHCIICDTRFGRSDKFKEHLRVKHKMKKDVYDQKLKEVGLHIKLYYKRYA